MNESKSGIPPSSIDKIFLWREELGESVIKKINAFERGQNSGLVIQQSSQLGLHQLVPSQDFPSKLRKYPELQVQTDDPGVFTQLWSQPPLLVSHSSISKKVQKISNSQMREFRVHCRHHVFLCHFTQNKFSRCIVLALNNVRPKSSV